MAGAGAVLEARDIALRYGGAPDRILSDFSLSVGSGEIVAVLGRSGVGKSTLLRVLAGLEVPEQGSISVAGTRLTDVHPRVAMAFQSACLLPWLDVEANVAFGLDFKSQPKLDASRRRQRVDDAIAEVGLSEARAARPSELSGGMAQRAALARCLARRPDVLLLDEPFGALDEVTRADMQRLLLRIVADHDAAAVLITHDIDEALLVADRIVLLGGRPASAIGTWTIDLPKPRDDLVAELGALRIDILTTLRRSIAAS